VVDLRTATIRLSAGKTYLVATDPLSQATIQVSLGSRYTPAPRGDVAALARELDNVPERADLAPIIEFLRGRAAGVLPDALAPVPSELLLDLPTAHAEGTPLGVVARIGLGTFGASFVLFGALQLVADARISLDKASSSGTVTSVSHGRGGYTATVEYASADGVPRRPSFPAFRPVVGQTVTIEYNAADPTEARIAGDWANRGFAVFAVLAGVAVMTPAVIVTRGRPTTLPGGRERGGRS
jgi:hypothetical protein